MSRESRKNQKETDGCHQICVKTIDQQPDMNGGKLFLFFFYRKFIFLSTLIDVMFP